MKIRIINTERKELATILAGKLRTNFTYEGTPTFAYTVGPYTICRDNTLEVDDEMADRELLRDLTEREHLDGSWDDGIQMLSISFPLSQHTGQSLANLVKIIACRQEIINHAVGYSGFAITDELAQALKKEKPQSTEEFLEILKREETGEQKGFAVEDQKVSLTGFPLSGNPDKVRAYTNLAAMINAMAIKQKRVHMEKPDLTNEKYSFRIWLLRLGMVGDEYKPDRKILLSKLSGNCTFRTPQQREAFFRKLKEQRDEKKRQAEPRVVEVKH